MVKGDTPTPYFPLRSWRLCVQPFAQRRQERKENGGVRGCKPMTPMEKNEPTQAGPPLTPERVFRDYAPRVYNLARRMLGNDADAEDVTQDVLLQVVRKLDTFRGESALATWLHRITVNAALAHRRKRALIKERQMQDSLDVFLENGHFH